MEVMGILVICLLFITLIISLVYFGAFHHSAYTMKPLKSQSIWDARGQNTDFAFISIKDDRPIGNRSTDYLLFYNPSTESDYVRKNIRLDPGTTFKKQCPIHISHTDLCKPSTWLGTILLFSFIIFLAVNAGYLLYLFYSWIM